MKILFAVSNENISKRIVDSYQKKYGESVSYKNVFYFNAIIREIHKDKTYDRIVISEDLEPFSSSNYDVIDKFILERLKQISNEISAQEKYIDIVIICTDRRTRSGIALSKMYEYRIYNALIGQDRRIDNVCKLLNTPRTAEEAREYYKIDSNQKDTNLVDDVSEQEVQNILIHYKRLGKNEDRYTDSFNNIASQYTDKQLKIIIKCLPLNVRAVLEAECPKYQELVTYADETEEERKQKQKLQEQRKIEQIENDRKLKQKVEKEKREAERNAKREELHRQSASSELKQIQESSGIDLLDNRRKEQRMTGNVVIPNSMNIRNERKIYSDKEIEDMSNQNRSPRTVTNEELKNNNSINLVNNTSAENTLPGFDDFEDVAQPVNSVTAENTLPGFDDFEDVAQTVNSVPAESTLPGFDDFGNIEQSSELPNINNEQTQMQIEAVAEQPEVPQQPKRGRGRPRKYPIEPPKPKGKRGRPRKNPLPEEKTQILPGINDFEDIPELERIQQTESSLPNQANQANIESTSNELPGMDDDWNKNPFEETTNIAQPSGTLPGMDDDWNKDPFEETTNVAQPSGTLPGMDDDWNKDPFEETTNVAEPSGTLPGMDDDWNKDPFAETTNVGEPSGTLQGMNENWIQNSSGTTSTDSEDDWNRDPFESDNKPNNSKNLKNDSVESTNSMVSGDLPHIEQSYNNYEVQSFNDQVTPYSPSQERRESIQKIEENKLYSTGSLDTVLTKDKKIVAFVGTSKNGTSFLVNNLACLFSSLGVKTAILDMTQNKNSYYIYTDNNENLRNIAYTSIENLENGIAEGIKVDRNLNIYTAVPNDNKDYSNSEAILSTLVQNESLILIDCDFQTDLGYFANSQEIYLVQSMDILTIQPLTAFLRELKTKGILDEERLRVVINKEVKVKGLSSKAVIGGMSFYIDPAMSFMTDLFNKDKVKACSIPFDENVYSKYIEQTVNCSISISGYNKNFMNSLKILGNMVYPLLSKQTYGNPKNSAEANYGNKFSSEMNNTLNQMKNKY